MSHKNDPPVIGNTDDTVEVTVPKGFLVADGNMEPEIVSLAAPEADPQQFAMDATGPIQTWTNEHVILPNIGDVDAKLLGLGGLSNTIVVSTTTAEVLATITVNIGLNGNWFVGDVDTGVPASGTDPESILRMVGAYIQAPMSYDVPTATMTISAGGHYVAYNGIAEGYAQFQVTGIITDVIAASTKVVSMDSAGVTYQHTDPDLLLIPESQVILATFEGSDPARVMTIFPTVHEMVYGLQGVVSEIDGKVAEAEAWAIAAANSAAAAAADAAQTAADRVQTGQDVVATAADRVQTGLAAAATADDRVATNADAVSTNADAAATAADRAVTSADALITTADRVQTGSDAASALDSKNLAQEYAVNPEDVPITGAPTDYSAYHWAEKAKASAESVVSGVHYKGQWDASLGAFPTPPPGPVDVVDYYRISSAGTMTGTGPQQPVTTAVGDSLYWDPVGLVWYEQESGDSVRTVNNLLPDSFGNINITTSSLGAVDLTSAQTIGGAKTFTSPINVDANRLTIYGGVDNTTLQLNNNSLNWSVENQSDGSFNIVKGGGGSSIRISSGAGGIQLIDKTHVTGNLTSTGLQFPVDSATVGVGQVRYSSSEGFQGHDGTKWGAIGGAGGAGRTVLYNGTRITVGNVIPTSDATANYDAYQIYGVAYSAATGIAGDVKMGGAIVEKSDVVDISAKEFIVGEITDSGSGPGRVRLGIKPRADGLLESFTSRDGNWTTDCGIYKVVGIKYEGAAAAQGIQGNAGAPMVTGVLASAYSAASSDADADYDALAIGNANYTEWWSQTKDIAVWDYSLGVASTPVTPVDIPDVLTADTLVLVDVYSHKLHSHTATLAFEFLDAQGNTLAAIKATGANGYVTAQYGTDLANLVQTATREADSQFRGVIEFLPDGLKFSPSFNHVPNEAPTGNWYTHTFSYGMDTSKVRGIRIAECSADSGNSSKAGALLRTVYITP